MYNAVRELNCIIWGISIGAWLFGRAPWWSVFVTLLVCMLMNAWAELQNTSIWRMK